MRAVNGVIFHRCQLARDRRTKVLFQARRPRPEMIHRKGPSFQARQTGSRQQAIPERLAICPETGDVASLSFCLIKTSHLQTSRDGISMAVSIPFRRV